MGRGVSEYPTEAIRHPAKEIYVGMRWGSGAVAAMMELTSNCCNVK